MPLDLQMTRLRLLLIEHEVDVPDGLGEFLPRRDGRPGKCFEEAEGIVLDSDPCVGLFLVHGKCRAPDGTLAHHAWVEVPGGFVYDAVLGRIYPWTVYQKTLLAVVEKRYDAKQVAAITRIIPHCGPWNDEEERLAFGRTCPKCGTSEYAFRSRKKIEATEGEPADTETKYRCKACGHEWKVRENSLNSKEN